MLRVACYTLLMLTASAAFAQDNQKKPTRKIPKPKFRISRETTRITEPLTKNGYVDYAAALNAHYGKGVLKHQNAAVLYVRLVESERGLSQLYKKLGIPIPEKKNCFRGYEKFLNSYYKFNRRAIEKFSGDEIIARNRTWKNNQFPTVSAWLKSNARRLTTITEASRKSKMFTPIVPYGNQEEVRSLIAMSPINEIREFGYALEARAMLHLGHENHDFAWEDLMTMQRMGRHVSQGPSILDMVIGISICRLAIEGQLRLVHFASPDSNALQKYLRDLIQLPPLPILREQIDLYERYFILDSVQFISRDDDARTLKSLESMRKHKKLFPGIGPGKKPIDWNIFLKMGNDHFDKVEFLLQKADKEQRGLKVIESLEKLNNAFMSQKAMKKRVEQAKTEREKMSVVYGYVWLGDMFPDFRGMKGAEYRCRQSQRNLIIAFALAGYKNDRNKYPEKLADLSPKYLDKIPGDIFSGKSLKYQPTKEGYLLYGVGPNGQDDKGISVYDRDKTGDDITVRMPPKVK